MKRIHKEACGIARHIHQWLNEYAPSFQSNSEHTIRSYGYTLSLFIHFLEVVKKIVPSGLCSGCFSRDSIEEWILWLKNKRNCSPETCNNRLASLRAFLKYLAGKDVALLYLAQDANQIPRQKTRKKQITGMSRQAVKALMLAPDITTKTGRMYLVLFIVLYNTAARIDELLSTKIHQLQLDTDKPAITVVGKGNKIRTLYLLPKTVAHLKKYLKEFHPGKPDANSFLFYSRNTGVKGKMSQRAINKQLKKYAALAHAVSSEVPVNLHAHQIRHAKASHWLEDGMNIVQISFLLGHSNIQTTMAYLDITTEQEFKALATLEDENAKNTPKKWKSNMNNLAAFCGVKQIKT
jgi:site-specific recombinase XerD